MHYSGIVVVAKRFRVGDCQRELESLPGVEVHYCEPETGRLVVVQETASAKEQERGFERIQQLPEVEAAALVEHRIDSEEDELAS
ncbi:MAG: chaperone NapD [Thermoanaerobaculia bacterium]